MEKKTDNTCEKSELQGLVEKMLEAGEDGADFTPMQIKCVCLPVIQALAERDLGVDDATLLCLTPTARYIAITALAVAIIMVSEKGDEGLNEMFGGVFK